MVQQHAAAEQPTDEQKGQSQAGPSSQELRLILQWQGCGNPGSGSDATLAVKVDCITTRMKRGVWIELKVIWDSLVWVSVHSVADYFSCYIVADLPSHEGTGNQ